MELWQLLFVADQLKSLELTPCMNKFEATLLIGELVLSDPLKKPDTWELGELASVQVS